MKIISFSCS